jgi:hypothetical protein
MCVNLIVRICPHWYSRAFCPTIQYEDKKKTEQTFEEILHAFWLKEKKFCAVMPQRIYG